MNVDDLLSRARSQLAAAGADSPRLDAELLMAHVLGVGRERLIGRSRDAITGDQCAAFEGLVARRVRHEPVAYLLGRREFYGLELAVDARVLVPRPETEHLVEVVLAALKEGGLPVGWGLDLGTGSGAVAIAIAHHCRAARLIASDVSRSALAVARANVGAHALGDRIHLVVADALDGIAPGLAFIASNPPYVGEDEREGMMRDVVLHEPECALFSGRDGTVLLERLVDQAPAWLQPAGLLAVECAPWQAESLVARASAWGRCEIARDLAGRPRIVVVRRRA